MLIVVSIIGILSAAILPRINGYLAGARDFKRQLDLRNVATAVSLYKENKGSYPIRDWKDGRSNPFLTEKSWGTLFWSYKWRQTTFAELLSEYLSPIPQDPQKDNMIAIHALYLKKLAGQLDAANGHFRWPWDDSVVRPWEYLYQITEKNWDLYGGALLVAKVETADYANYVLTTPEIGNFKGWSRWTHRRQNDTQKTEAYTTIHETKNIGWRGRFEDLKLCTSIKKVRSWEEKYQINPDWTVDCRYSNPNQLYYILKVDE